MADQLCTIAQVKARLQTPSGSGATFTAADNAVLTELIEEVSDFIQHYTARKFVPEVAATYTFDTSRGYVLNIPRGIRTVTSMGVNTTTNQPDTGGSYTAVTAAQILKRPLSGDLAFGWPPTQIILSAVTGTPIFGSIQNGATITGDFGFAATPPDIQAVAIDTTVTAWQNRKNGASGVIGADDNAIVPFRNFYSRGSPQRATLDRYRYIPV